MGLGSHGEIAAANDYDKRHMGAAHFTQGQLATLRYIPTSLPHQDGFRSGLHHVLRNRYVADETYDPFTKIEPRQPRHKRAVHRYHKGQQKWKLEESVWLPRRDHGNSKDFFETTSSLQTMLLADWEVARIHHELAWRICKMQLRPEAIKAFTKESCLTAPCVEAVHTALRRHANIIYNLFDYYANLDEKPSRHAYLTSEGPKIYKIHLNAFGTFLIDCNVVDHASKTCDLKRLQTVFSIVDAPDKFTEHLDQHNEKAGLGRHEWIQCLVIIASLKFCKALDKAQNPKLTDVADAFESFAHDHLAPSLAPMFQPGARNLFRKKYCYREDVDTVLQEHKATLKEIYSVYAAASNHGMSDHHQLEDKRIMNAGEWLTFVEHVGLHELGLVTVPVAIEAFMWSRIRTVKDYSDEQEMRIRHLFFEDFMEAIVRLASIVALPTFQEVEESGASDAGDFVLALYTNATAKTYQAFLMGRKTTWEEPPSQRIFRCVEYLIEIIKDIVVANSSADKEKVRGTGPLTHNMVVSFFKRRMEANGDKIAVPKKMIDSEALIKAMEKIESHLMDVLGAVPAFSGISRDKLKVLLDAMHCARYSDGEYVIEQGEEGECFFLITGGEAEVFRYEPDDPTKEEFLLNTLSSSACFGEAALLNNAPRNATIAAKGELHAVFVSREMFEEVLGPLSQYQVGLVATQHKGPEINEELVLEVLSGALLQQDPRTASQATASEEGPSAERLQRYIEEFKAIDKDGSGSISEEEFYEAMQKCGVTDNDLMQGIYEGFDRSGDGEIELDEYLEIAKVLDTCR